MKQGWMSFSRRRRFLILLVSLLLAAVLSPIISTLGLMRVEALLDIFFALVLVSSVYAVSERKKPLIASVLLVVPILLLMMISYVWRFQAGPAVLFLQAAYLFLMVIIILRFVLRASRVTFEKISAALCVYFLLGMFWARLYMICKVFQPESFLFETPTSHDFTYFSFITLTTLGYGDVIPQTPPAKALAYVEALFGQLFLAVLVARLVALQIIHSQEPDEPS